ncbi:MAG: ribonuclease Y [Candidatus Paceibacteria bacterium]|jgi:ribonuclease Y
MSLLIILLIAMAAGLAGIAIGWFLRFIISLGKKGSMELEIKEMILGAREEVERIMSETEKDSSELIKQTKSEVKELEEKSRKTEERLIARENMLDKRQLDIDDKVGDLDKDKEKIFKTEEELKMIQKERISALENTSNLNTEEAKKELISVIEKEYSEDIVARIQKLEIAGKEKIEEKAKTILISAIQRFGNSVQSDVFTTTVTVPKDDIKGKIIGKEGRNIKTFERLTGVELIIDDTPGAVIISSFDPIRRQIASIALTNLITDGRIQPAKIELAVEKAQKEIGDKIKEKGEQAVYECGIFNLDPRIVTILGRLYFRSSYGQNVLQHSIEMSHIAGMIAEEVGANVKVAKAGALLHDIGKAVDHEVAGTHVEIGRRILQKFGADEEVIKAMQAHHEEYPFETIESVIVQVADSISGSRPGARRDTVENYLKRLDDLEALAKTFKGVENSYALQAGREIRVFVKPDKINDLEAHNLSKNIAKKIENELKYPGEIKVTVIRENKIVEYAR